MNAWKELKQQQMIKIASERVKAYNFLKQAGLDNPTLSQVDYLVMKKLAGRRLNTLIDGVKGALGYVKPIVGGGAPSPSGAISGINKVTGEAIEDAAKKIKPKPATIADVLTNAAQKPHSPSEIKTIKDQAFQQGKAQGGKGRKNKTKNINKRNVVPAQKGGNVVDLFGGKTNAGIAGAGALGGSGLTGYAIAKDESESKRYQPRNVSMFGN